MSVYNVCSLVTGSVLRNFENDNNLLLAHRGLFSPRQLFSKTPMVDIHVNLWQRMSVTYMRQT